MLIAVSEEKLQKLLDKVTKESEKDKQLTLKQQKNYHKKRFAKGVSFGDVRNKQVEKFHCLDSVVTGDRKCNTNI